MGFEAVRLTVVGWHASVEMREGDFESVSSMTSNAYQPLVDFLSPLSFSSRSSHKIMYNTGTFNLGNQATLLEVAHSQRARLEFSDHVSTIILL